MNNNYHLKIADISVCINSPVDLFVSSCCGPFITDQSNLIDITYDYQIGLPLAEHELIHKMDPVIHKSGNGYLVEREHLGKCCSCVYLEKPYKRIPAWIYPENEKRFTSLQTLLGVSELEIPLSASGIFNLHSSVIKINNKTILFSAPSGTGKSTQANLWEKSRCADIINGDRALIRKKNGLWTAYGSPFAGSSEIYRNENAPIQTVVVLEQAPYNEIDELTPAKAFRHIYAETIIPRWNNEIHLALMDLLTDFVREVKIVKLRCLPDQSAVDLLDNYMNREI